MWWGFCGGLGFAVTVCGAHLEGVVARGGVPVVDVLAPGIFGELCGEAGGVPGLAAVGRDLDLLDAAVRGPGDAAYRVLACGEVVAGLMVSMRDWVLTGPSFDQVRWIQYASKFQLVSSISVSHLVAET